ncbi:MAG: prephenate dehydrogenase [Vicinamibacterales bacterium]
MGEVAPPGTVAVIGLGLIGLSVAGAARRRWPGVRIVGVDQPGVLRHPAVVTTVDVGATAPAASQDADLVVVATPVDVTVGLLPALASVLPPDTPVVDTASLKGPVVAAAGASGLRGFIGGHPMAGNAGQGPGAASADLFDGRPWILTGRRDAAAAGAIAAFVEGLGARVAWLDDAATHDRLMAAISQVPQVVASALMVVVGESAGAQGLGLAGPGLRDTTRLAASPAGLWEGLLPANAGNVAPLLRALADLLRQTADTLETEGAVRRLFETANRWKASVPD